MTKTEITELKLKKLELIATFDPGMTAVEMYKEFNKTYKSKLHAFYRLRREVFGNVQNKKSKGVKLKELDFGTKIRECILCHEEFETPVDKNDCSLHFYNYCLH